jgi:hypothetical protein
MFGICSPSPKYTGAGQPPVVGASVLGLFELITGVLKTPTPAYVGKVQAAPAPGLLCSFLSTPQPAYVKARRCDGRTLTSAPTRTGAERT